MNPHNSDVLAMIQVQHVTHLGIDFPPLSPVSQSGTKCFRNMRHWSYHAPTHPEAAGVIEW